MIKLENIIKIYNKGKANEFLALSDVSLKIDNGELVAIIGKSGAGKSTLLHILACIDNYDSGEYYLDDVLIKGQKDSELSTIRNKYIGIVMQDYALVEDFTAIENVLMPLDFAKHKKKKEKEKRKIALEALAAVDLADCADKMVNELSGGQKQRVAIARAVVNKPKILLADEPTGALDSKNGEKVMDIFKKLNADGITCIIITHDMDVANKCSRIIEMADGNVAGV